MHSRFDGQSVPQEHLEHCYETWKHVPRRVHRLIRIRALVAENWYTEAKLRQDTVSWDCLVDNFVLTFSINEVCPALDAAVRLIHNS